MATILIVDDSTTLRQLTRAPLEAAGHRVIEAGNGVEALAMLERETVNLVITDVNMPQMNGLDFVSQLRGKPGCKTLPVFFITTESSQDMLQRGKELGATAWLVKPFKPDVLMKGVQHVLSKPS